ncbi:MULTISPECIES: hypothetical protein [Leptolyngbya]|jgi:hypothetical protein|uniref:hypothetical protein n=1 Tax=Leptolyngbya TaxID=47251 RepID=UPI00035DD884|nr:MULTISPECIES: hypothetical protein [Leptolyngbya]MBD2371087.1 hypothetical protein [Leptolyngbya sp. FACHB-161]MBD2377555.1 hypothetical protein [Leptolyngbya sp. FACHB-238]MBD2402008.1 hypothetical protein [Leptolyngbya sp. FACHB-239]MBD2408527.1 hypothetical protein [Leptolyngbya sp. FACHB-402]BAS60425.1 hypothetical protein LBWT_Y0130 [Leptolyngbya boryana IAM M-101]
MVKLSKEALKQIQSELGNVNASWQEEFNLRQTVEECFDLIESARSYNVSWERITDIIKKASGTTEGISPASISKYYLELAKTSKTQQRKKKKTSVPKRKQIESNKDTSPKIIKSTSEAVANPQSSTSEESSNSDVNQNEDTQSRTSEKFGSFYGSDKQKVSDQFNI